MDQEELRKHVSEVIQNAKEKMASLVSTIEKTEKTRNELVREVEELRKDIIIFQDDLKKFRKELEEVSRKIS